MSGMEKRLTREQKIASGLSRERFGAANYVFFVNSFLRNNHFQIVYYDNAKSALALHTISQLESLERAL